MNRAAATRSPARHDRATRHRRPDRSSLALAGRAGNRAMRRLLDREPALARSAIQRASLTVWDGTSSSSKVVYRSGTTFVPKSGEYKTTRDGKKVKPTHGVSVHENPPALETRLNRSLGSWYELESIPSSLKIKQRGRDKEHYEVMHNLSTWPTPSEFTTELAKVTVKSTAATFG